MGVDTRKLRAFAHEKHPSASCARASLEVTLRAAADEIDALRAQNAVLMGERDMVCKSMDSIMDALRCERSDESALMAIYALREDRRDLAEALVDAGWTGDEPQDSCRGCGVYRRDLAIYRHFVMCPVALAERVLAEPVANTCAISGDNAPDVERSESLNDTQKRTAGAHG